MKLRKPESNAGDKSLPAGKEHEPREIAGFELPVKHLLIFTELFFIMRNINCLTRLNKGLFR